VFDCNNQLGNPILNSCNIIFPGSKQVEITGLEDKKQITALLSCTMSGNLLPSQLLYQGNITLTSVCKKQEHI
jgi:hypothetical protein